MTTRGASNAPTPADPPPADTSDVEVQVTRPAGWGIVAAAIIRDASLSAATRLVYAGLATYADSTRGAFPSAYTLADELGLSRTTVRAALRELEAVGYLTVQARHAENGRTRSNLVTLLDGVGLPPARRSTSARGGGGTQDLGGSMSDPPRSVSGLAGVNEWPPLGGSMSDPRELTTGNNARAGARPWSPPTPTPTPDPVCERCRSVHTVPGQDCAPRPDLEVWRRGSALVRAELAASRERVEAERIERAARLEAERGGHLHPDGTVRA